MNHFLDGRLSRKYPENVIPMYTENEEAIVAPLATLSLDNLAEFAMDEELIDGFDLADDDVTIVQGDRCFRLPYRQASTFLIGMLRGRSWHVDDPVRRERVAAGPDLEQPRARDAALPDQAGGHRSLESTLDALLTFTRDVGIILSYCKEPEDRRVLIDISACSSVFSYVDAVGYLFDCVQHEVRAMTEAA